MIKRYVLTALSCLLLLGVVAQNESILGTWKTIDDGTGKAKSIVKLYMKDGKVFGDIIKLINEDPNYDPLCTECTGDLKDKKILGMTIVKNLSKDGDLWKGDDGIMDPDNGKYYYVKMWRTGKELRVRGYIGPFFRTQTWHLVE